MFIPVVAEWFHKGEECGRHDW